MVCKTSFSARAFNCVLVKHFQFGEILLRNNSLARACGKQRFVIAIHNQKLFAIVSFFIPIVSIPIIWEVLVVIPFTLVLSIRGLLVI